MATVRGAYYTDFIALQRVLSFGPDCVVLSPEGIKTTLIEKLQNYKV